MRRPGVALAVLAALAREALLVRPGEGLDGFRLAMASFSRDFLSQLKALEHVSTERVATRSCGGRRDDKSLTARANLLNGMSCELSKS